MAMSIAQQGSGFPFFSSTTYQYYANKDIATFDVILEDIPNPEVRRFLAEVRLYGQCSVICDQPYKVKLNILCPN